MRALSLPCQMIDVASAVRANSGSTNVWWVSLADGALDGLALSAGDEAD